MTFSIVTAIEMAGLAAQAPYRRLAQVPASSSRSSNETPAQRSRASIRFGDGLPRPTMMAGPNTREFSSAEPDPRGIVARNARLTLQAVSVRVSVLRTTPGSISAVTVLQKRADARAATE